MKTTVRSLATPKRILCVAGVLILIVSAVAAAASRRPQPLSLERLVAADPDIFLDVTFVFRPLDCKLAPGLIRQLNALARVPDFAVRGVMVQPPIGPGEPEMVLRDFEIRFPVTIDAEGQWTRTLAEERMPNPVLVLSQKGTRLAAVSPQGLAIMQRYLPELARDF